MPTYKQVFTVLVFAGIASGLTYYFAPTKVKIKEVEKIVLVQVEQKEVKKDITTITTKKPDGTVVIEEKDKSIENSTKDTTTVTEKSKSKEITRKKKDWIVGVGILNPTVGEPSGFYGQIQRRIIGEVYLGVIATTEKSVGIGISFGF